MGVIAPNSQVIICENVPLDNTYDHTIWFDSYTAQRDYFNSLRKVAFGGNTYIRKSSNVIRVPNNADYYFDCNYLMFQNTSFSDKWFYAFITDAQYVNNECTEITFELDVIQSWLFDFRFSQTFVLREHSALDIRGENLEPEGIDIGDYVVAGNHYDVIADGNIGAYIVAVADVNAQQGGGAVQGNYYGLYSGAKLWGCMSISVALGQFVDPTVQLNKFLSNYIQRPEAILAIYTVSKAEAQGLYFDDVEAGENNQTLGWVRRWLYSTNYAAVDSQIQYGDTLDGYTPKNQKMYTYPYNMYGLSNFNGEFLSTRYEFFHAGIPRFKLSLGVMQPHQIVVRPTQYKGWESGFETPTESISLTNYPIIGWVNDAYQQWVAQQGFATTLGLITGIGGAVIAGTVNPFAGIQSGVNVVASALSQYYTASVKADVAHGQTNVSNANILANNQQIIGRRMCVPYARAQVIDDFFSMYGYATNRLKTPNRNSRPHWNYVKTASCNLHGSVPANSMRKICEIHDRGITYWKNGNEVGHYNLDNRAPQQEGP